jgi:ABC-2 type transport system ATP-binding protein
LKAPLISVRQRLFDLPRGGYDMSIILKVNNLNKIYASGFEALSNINLEIEKGEIFALLGPNGAGKTTLIGIICGLINATSGTVEVAGYDHVLQYRKARELIGIVPQELTVDAFEEVEANVAYSRGLFGKAANPEFIKKLLRKLSLLDKRGERIMALSGGMKRRLLIAKALAHEPQILFLDEPTAGVDVELRKSMWETVCELRENGVTVILTTHYIEEAEEMADRIGVINKGKIIVVDRKAELMRKLGQKQLILQLESQMDELPPALQGIGLSLSENGQELSCVFDGQSERMGISALLNCLRDNDVVFRDMDTKKKSLEDIFISLVREAP